MSFVTSLNQWLFTPEKEISFEHCGRPAYWEEEDVFCSKCSEMLGPDSLVLGF